jgi:hypothetical protein
LTTEQALNRGFNLMLTAILLLTGLAFASGGIRENDLTDKLDDLLLLAGGIVLLVWYLLGENRFQRSLIPVIVILLAVPLQIWGLLNEINDKEAVGNDIGGMFIYIPLALFALYQYLRPPRIAASTPPA